MKQTAVEWLIEQIKEYDFSPRDNTYLIEIPSWILKERIEKAKEMEKQQMIEFAEYVATYPDKNRNVNGEILHAKSKYDGAERTIDLLEQYYNETYGSKGSDETKSPKINTWDDIFDNIESEMDCVVPLKVTNYLEEHYMKPTPLQTDENGKPLTYWGGLDKSSQTTSDKWKEYQDWLNEVPEISDEEIEKAVDEYYNDDRELHNPFSYRDGIEWYKEQLKKKQ